MMTLIENWDAVIKHAWSVKFSVISALLAGAEVAVQIINPTTANGNPNVVFAILAGLVSVGAVAARVLAQKEISGASDPAATPK
jgi:hypothetical protein